LLAGLPTLPFALWRSLAYNQRVSNPSDTPINARTRYCALFGHPVRHSASPTMQNPGMAALGLNWRYLAFAVPPDQLRDAIAGAKAMKFIGLNLTVPHKLPALRMMDALDESAQTWGAVNTVRFEAQDPAGNWRPLSFFAETVPEPVRSHGFNTDAEAIARALREELGQELAGAKVLLLGAGGAGRVAALKLAAENAAELFLVNRTASTAAALAAEIAARFPGVKARAGYPQGSVDLLVNATSLGLQAGDELPFDPARFRLDRTRAVYDMIYHPAQTPLLAAAKAAGRATANGLGMLLRQGASSLELWSGQAAPIKEMRAALEASVYGH
jgi:shikimate dehydrogenase